ncbi:MAG: ribokinase [Reichenbachiella sp.]
MKLVVIGSSNMDLVISLPRIPAIGETVLGGKSSTVFGGKGANQAVAALRSGGDVTFIAKVGNDLYGEKMMSHFEQEGFDMKNLLTDPTEPTGIAQIFVSAKGENSIAVAPGANMTLMPADLKPFEDMMANAEVVLMQLETPIESITYLANLTLEHNVKLILNPAPAQKLSDDLLKKLWLITPNETEASLLTGIEVTDDLSAQEAAKALLKKGVQNVIITLGEKGSLLSNSDGAVQYHAYKANAVDTTAAGDVFNGALAVAITENKPFEEAIDFAAAAAAISVTRAGAQTSIPTLEEITNFLSESKN